MAPAGAPRISFGLFRVDPDGGALWKNGRRIPLQDQPFRVLVVLIERAGTVVSREDLRKTLWPSDTYGEFDQGLNTAIKKLRHALGDSADNPRFIETVPRKGYRFIAPVSGVESKPVVEAPRSRTKLVWLLAALGVGLAAMAVWLVRSRPAPSPSLPAPFTSYAGQETEPGFSPDGSQVAFTWNGEKEENLDIYVKQIGTEKLARLTTDAAPDFGPAWSPDGRLIAFARRMDPDRTAILLTPAAGGGPEVKVTEVATIGQRRSFPFMAWSPDGKWLAITDADLTKAGAVDWIGARSLFLVSIETGKRRRLTTQDVPPTCDYGPAFAPSGRTLAFVRSATIQVSDLYLLPLSRDYAPSGRPRRLTAGIGYSSDPAWTPDGAHLVFTASGEYESRLWMIATTDAAEARPLLFAGARTRTPAISHGGKLAYTQNYWRQEFQRIELSAPGVAAGPAKRFLATTQAEQNAHFSPDGKRIAFGSNRSGFTEIWTAGADGTDPTPLTSMRAPVSGGLNWSPDGSRIVFDSSKDGHFDVYVVSAAGGAPQRLTDHPADDGAPSWSRDGSFIYFMSTRSGEPQVWKMSAGGGAAVQVTKKRGTIPEASADDEFVYYYKLGALWKVPSGGGEEREVLPSVTFMNFTVTGEGIYFIPRAVDGRYFLQFSSFTMGKTVTVAPLSAPPGEGLGVSPDGKTLLYTQSVNSGSDLMLVERFR